jgi:hypothetical protein
VSLLAKSRALFARDLMIMSRLAMAWIAYLVLGALAYATLSDPRIRLLTLLILALFAFKSWVRRKDVMHPDRDRESG